MFLFISMSKSLSLPIRRCILSKGMLYVDASIHGMGGVGGYVILTIRRPEVVLV